MRVRQHENLSIGREGQFGGDGMGEREMEDLGDIQERWPFPVRRVYVDWRRWRRIDGSIAGVIAQFKPRGMRSGIDMMPRRKCAPFEDCPPQT